MEIKNSRARGWYTPGYFHIRVNTYRGIFDLDSLLRSEDPDDRVVLSTFIHEYIHFLQEVTTTSGVFLLGLMIDFIKDVNFEILNDGQPIFKVPFEYSNKYNTLANKTLIGIYRGGGKAGNALYDGFSMSEIPVVDRTGFERKVPQYTVCYREEDGTLKEFIFGSICLKEFVTHTMQDLFAPGVKHGEIPYKIAGQIIQKE